MNIPEALRDIDSVLQEQVDADDASANYARFAAQMITQYQSCIYRYAPPGSTYRAQADKFASMSITKGSERLPGGAGPYAPLAGILRALRADVAADRLKVFEEVARADVFADLISQGEQLHESRYSRAAAVVVGAALEEHIKKLAVKFGISVIKADGTYKKAAEINAELKKANVYSEMQRSGIDAWQKLRNDAAHGVPGFEGQDSSKVGQIDSMITSVRAFIAQYPA